MNSGQIGLLFDAQVRQGTASDGTGSAIDATTKVVRWSATGNVGWSEVAWSKLDETDADQEIAKQVEYFSSRGLSFVWRLYETDLPRDMDSRLERAGFELDHTSELMIATVADIEMDVDLPPGVFLSTEKGPVGIDRLIEVHEKVFGIDHSQLRRSLLAQFSSSPWITEVVVALSEDSPIASSRIEFLPDRLFASLWGGSTLPQWRGKGLFRAMVAHRAREAAMRGYAYVYVMASAGSRPILDRMSFTSFGRVMTYRWQHVN